MSDLWTGLAIALILEGLWPFLTPQRWREAMLHATQLRQGQIRFIGLLAISSGLLLLTLLR